MKSSLSHNDGHAIVVASADDNDDEDTDEL